MQPRSLLADGDFLVAARHEFERQHSGRNLTRHKLRGTYVSGPIAALWNQHLRTITWMSGVKK